MLVGREDELRRLIVMVSSSGSHPTIEGDNGVGKTSLVAIAGYRALERFRSGNLQSLIMPLRKPFQLEEHSTAEDLERAVLFEVAHAFTEHDGFLKEHGYSAPDTGAVNKWINAPTFRSGGGGAFGFSAEGGSEPNTSAGFEEAGFRNAVLRWLQECFPSRQAGGFLAILDNLELLQTSQRAKHLLEAARDGVLSLPGIRWVLSGAKGIVNSAAASQRLQGVLASPLQVKPIPDNIVGQVVARRVDEFKIRHDAYAPVDQAGFNHIYRVMNANLRNALNAAEQFAIWTVLEDSQPLQSGERLQLLEVWLADQAEQHAKATSGLGRRAWEVFDHLIELGGSCSPSDYGVFRFASQQAMRPHIKDLEDAELVDSFIDETDQRRRTIHVTSRGWLVNYHRSGYSRTAR
ncbi:MAG: hypothetical protein M3O70_21015 [Actinomycetota bacterium]|nr:hypothetical protein [Actinomycetota bacterium]